jgi:hypothetical protein
MGGRLMDWAKGSDSSLEKTRKELSDQVAEIAVEREMQKETAEDAKQEEERKIIEAAMERSSPNVALEKSTAHAKHTKPVRRIILRDPGRGSIVSMKVFEELDLLCVLRDTGRVCPSSCNKLLTDYPRLLDIFRTDTLSEVSTIHLEEPNQRNVASSSKTPLRLSPFWQWQNLHLLSQGDVSHDSPIAMRDLMVRVSSSLPRGYHGLVVCRATTAMWLV